MPAVEVVPVAQHEKERRSVQRVTFGTHVSTHFDAPLHAIPDGQTIDQVPIDTFTVGTAELIRFKECSRRNPIDKADLSLFEDRFSGCDRVVLETGWAEKTWGTREYFTQGPYLTRAAAHYISQFSIKLIGTDFPNIDSAEETKPGIPAPNHEYHSR